MSATYNLGSRVWPGLSKLVEEAGEVVQVGGKIMGTGGEPEHWDGTNLLRRAGEEVADLSAACRVFFQLNGLDGAPWVLEREKHKYQLFLQWHFDNLEDKPDAIGPGNPGWSKWQRFLGAGSDLHYQIYWSWRIYRQAMIHTSLLSAMVGSALTTLLWLIVNG